MASPFDARKCVVRSALGSTSLQNGGKAAIHLRAYTEHGQLVDDTRELGQPFWLRLGKKFCMPLLETAVRSMHVGEIASFKFTAEESASYPQLSLILRSSHKEQNSSSCEHSHEGPSEHQCGLAASRKAVQDNADLFAIIGNPLVLEIELVEYSPPGTYEREYWEVTLLEKVHEVPQLKDRGNELYRRQQYRSAAEQYTRALSYIDRMKAESANISQLPSGDVEIARASQVPLLINLAACTLKLADYPVTIERCTQALKIDPVNVKALYRRSLAYASQERTLDKAMDDLDKAVNIEPDNKDVLRQRNDVRLRLKAVQQREEKIFSKVLLE